MSIIHVQNLTYYFPDRTQLFSNISLTINEGQKAALVGRNGTGKTTLLKAIKNHPAYKEIELEREAYMIPQHTEHYINQTIAEVLQVAEKVAALHAILSGSADVDDFDVLNDDWEVEVNATIALAHWGLSDFTLTTPFAQLSGGERTKVFLAGLLLHKPTLVLMDEPTNHLDSASRDKLYTWIKQTSATLLIVSHDRTLLNALTDIYELSSEGIAYYKGNYDTYMEQKEIEGQALLRRIESQRNELKKAQRVQQQVAERLQRQEARSASQAAKKSLPKIVAGNWKRNSERSSAKIMHKHAAKREDLNESLKQLQKEKDTIKELKLEFHDSILHTGKILINAEHINFRYKEDPLWSDDLNFIIYSGDRVLITGGNGSGKTTLIKLFTQGLNPTKGQFKNNEFDYLYLDQNYSLINLEKTVYEQAQSFNPNMPESEVKRHLARSQFAADTWDKSCQSLSGGEKMKLSLCSLIISAKAPDMLILDEPTNNLDIDSMRVLTSTIQQYNGTLILVSHDAYFIEEVGVNKQIEL